MPEDSETEPSVKAQAEGEISNEKFIDNSSTQKAKDLLRPFTKRDPGRLKTCSGCTMTTRQSLEGLRANGIMLV